MSGLRNQLFLLVAILGLILQGCQEDSLLSDDLITEEGRRGGGNNGGGNNGGNNNDDTGIEVSTMENTIALQWSELMMEVERYATGMRPNASARSLAYIHLAAYETAVPSMAAFASTDDLLRGLQISDNRDFDDINMQIALNTCYADVVDHFLYNVPADIDVKIGELEETLSATLTAGVSNRVVNESEEWGAYVAEQIIEYSQTDRQGERQAREPQPTSYEPPTGPGFWTYSADPERALFPYWESVRTFVVSTDETTTLPPLEYSENPNSEYYAEMKEVYEVNNAAKTTDQNALHIAEFWSDDVEGLMMSPPARQFAIANQLIVQYDQNLAETLHLFLKLGFSLNDAAVSTWKYKYEHMVMRPNVFIHEHIDPDFQTNLFRLVYWPNPSFPGYPSGHSTFASAAGGVFIDFFGNQTNFTDRTHEGRTEFLGEPRTFSTFEDMAAENAFSRIPLGVHPRMDCAEGLRLGYEIADGINALDLTIDL